ncbi:protein FRA10AC1 [Onthophagus taurus]|uniref:protein FRA10AC1 n=1 Tax=Onthophagus taurus TaxID=166361 RepID=UPI0039BE008C
MSVFDRMRYMNPYDFHKALINEYVLKKPGDTKFLQRDTSSDKSDSDVLKSNHKFLWDDDNVPETWEERFAKKYYDKLFKEYCITDLTLYKENKIALRWRVEKEVVSGKGQFICGNKKCDEKEGLRSWEVNFSYVEKGEKKNALVKIRLCESCSKKLNYHTKRKEVKRLKSKKFKNTSMKEKKKSQSCSSTEIVEDNNEINEVDKGETSLWANLKPVEIKSREEEIDEYLEELLL